MGFRKKMFWGGAIGLLVGLLFLTLTGLFVTITVAIQGYRALTQEEVAARVKIEPTGLEEFVAYFSFPNGRKETFSLAGDQFYVDAHILKWKPVVNFFGLHTAYELDRVAGRYTRLEDELSKPRTIFFLSKSKSVDIFSLRARYSLLSPLLDAEYGSATFIPAKEPTEVEVPGVEFIAANTDTQALATNLAPLKLQLGASLTKGLGAGANPEIGKKAALEDLEKIREVLKGVDMVFITAGLGGGTGTGGAPVIAEVAREMGALTVAIVTKPFQFEGKKRMKQAEEGLANLKMTVDALITIPNQKLVNISGKSVTLLESFKKADEILYHAAKGISDIIVGDGIINLDFADVRTIMSETGMALMGTGIASGENRSVEAGQKAISSPLLEDISIEGARGLLINVTGGENMTLSEVNEATTLIQRKVHEDANIIWGAVIDSKMLEEIRITVIATGFGMAKEKAMPKAEAVKEKAEPIFFRIGDGLRENGKENLRDHLKDNYRKDTYRESFKENSKDKNRDIPTFIRKAKVKERFDELKLVEAPDFPAEADDRVDVPTFMRKGAD